MFKDLVFEIMENQTKTLSDLEPEKLNHLTNSMLNMIKIGTELLKISPEFRQGFADIHGEFLKYPESEATIKEAIAAYKKYTTYKGDN